MLAGLIVLSILALLVLSRLWELLPQRLVKHLPHEILHDDWLAYHLDWDILQAEHFRLYHFVKKANASRRYAELTGMSRAEAWHAIQDLNQDRKRKLHRIEEVLSTEHSQILHLAEQGKLDLALERLSQTLELDKFTAQEVLQYWLEESQS